MPPRKAADKGDRGGLGPREAAVLRAVIRQHVVTGEPIGSKTVCRGTRLDLSPATIRNVMSELERQGLLAQPHTSAGRVPTDRAYRLYVDHLIPRPRMAAADAQAIDVALSAKAELPELLAEASRQLSSFSNQVGLVLVPELTRIVVDHLEFVRLDARRVVAILVARSGVVHNRILQVDAGLDQAELDRIGRYLSTEFGGNTLSEMRDLLEERMREERARYDQLVARSLALGHQALDADSDGDLIVEGATNLLASPEFKDLEVLRGLLRTLEDKKTLVDLLARVLEGSGVQVVIGEENATSELARLSVVASRYRAGQRVIGTVGIVGPTRMEYARAIGLVDHLASKLTDLLSEAPD